ncbi:MAG: hypothetical protein R3F59_11925 [Myxococcota bacterium]
MLLTLLLSLSVAQADPVAQLAPGPLELGTSQDELVDRLVTSEAMEVAVARIQSVLQSTTAFDDLCRDPLRGPLTVKLRLFGAAWHDAAQRVRVQAERVDRVAKSPTVVPIIDDDRRLALDALLKRARKQEASWLEFVAWVGQARPEVCAVDLETQSGIPDPIVRAQGESQGAVAVLARTPGFVCAEGATEGVPTDGRPMVIDGPVCWSERQKCACTPARVDPTAMLGP